VRVTPFGVSAGAVLLFVGSLPMWVGLPSADQASPEDLTEQLETEEGRADRLADALAQANELLAEAGQRPVPSTASPTTTTGPDRPPEGLGSSSVPPPTTSLSTTSTTTSVLPTTLPSSTVPSPLTSNPPPPPVCPPGTRAVIRVIAGGIRAWVCIPDHN